MLFSYFLLKPPWSSVPKLVDGIAFAPAPTPLFSCGALLCCLRPVPRSHALVCLRASLLLRLYPSLSWVGELGSSFLRRAASGQPSKKKKKKGVGWARLCSTATRSARERLLGAALLLGRRCGCPFEARRCRSRPSLVLLAIAIAAVPKIWDFYTPLFSRAREQDPRVQGLRATSSGPRSGEMHFSGNVLFFLVRDQAVGREAE